MARQPGTKEVRYTHLLSGEPVETVVAALREEIVELRAQVEKLLRLAD